MPDRSFSPGTPDVQRHAERGDPVKFQCLIGHSVPGLLLIVSVSSVLASEFQCLIGHSVPGPVHGKGWSGTSRKFQCLIGHSVPGPHRRRTSESPERQKKFQCLIGHSVPGHLSDVSTPQPLSEEFQCLIGHSVPGLRIEYTFDITGLPPSSSLDTRDLR